MTDEEHKLEHIEIHKALFGDPESGEMGIVQMNREMYQAWSAVILLGKAITAVAMFFAAIGSAWIAFGSSIKHFFNNK